MFSFSHSYQKGVFYIRLSVWVVYLLPEPWWRALYMIISSNFTLKTLCSAWHTIDFVILMNEY